MKLIERPLEFLFVITWNKAKRSIAIALWSALSFSATGCLAEAETNLIVIYSVTVDGQRMPFKPGREVNLGPFPRHVAFAFDLAANAIRVPLRLRHKLEGIDNSWRVGGGEMNLTIRFESELRDLVELTNFTVRNDSPGWNGSLETSPLTHRREMLTVPPKAARLFLIISSAGAATAVGTYVVDNIIVSRLPTNGGKSEILLRSPFDQQSNEDSKNLSPTDWTRDGIHPSMAKIVEIGQSPNTKAFAIVDDDRFAHAEWHNSRASAPTVAPNDRLVIEWNEMYSIGDAGHGPQIENYDTLPSGIYRFRIEETTMLGKPTGVEATLAVRVPVAFWKTAWFWALLAAVVIGSSALIVRHVARLRLQRAMLALRQEHALEKERLRIAQNIHDDLGSRVTQISMVSAMALNDSALSEKTRAQLDRVAIMSRELVSALYETVWACNPEHDNLGAMVNYLCEKSNEFCLQAQLRCRLNISAMPKDVKISSRVRHNILMAAKEALHNVIKHAKASQVNIRIDYSDSQVTILIQDDGVGFDSAGATSGNGLMNLKRRMEDIGGSCHIESSPGKGTMVHLRLVTESRHQVSLANRLDGAASLQPGAEHDKTN